MGRFLGAFSGMFLALALAAWAPRLALAESDEDPFAFLNDGSLERGESPDPDKVLNVIVKTKVILVKKTVAAPPAIPAGASGASSWSEESASTAKAAARPAPATTIGTAGANAAASSAQAELNTNAEAGGAQAVSFGTAATPPPSPPPPAPTAPDRQPAALPALPLASPPPVVIPDKL